MREGYQSPIEAELERRVGNGGDVSHLTERFARYELETQGVRIGSDPSVTLKRDVDRLSAERTRLLGEVVELGSEITKLPGINQRHLNSLANAVKRGTDVTAQAQKTYERELVEEGYLLAKHEVLREQGNALAGALHRMEEVHNEWIRDVRMDHQDARAFFDEFRRVQQSNDTLGGIVTSRTKDVIRDTGNRVGGRVQEEIGKAVDGVLDGIFGGR